MQIILVEDELLIAEMLKEMLLDLGHQVVDIADDYDSAIKSLQQHKADLIFLDINLGAGKSGFDVAQYINEQQKTPFVFLTSYSDKTTISGAMQYQPHAYLLKPFSETDLFTTLELLKSRAVNTTQDKHFVIKDGIENIKIAANEVLHFKANNIYVEIKTTSKTHLIRTSITKLLEDLGIDFYVRVHRTFAVNLNKVQAVGSDYLLIQDEKIPLSRMHKEELHHKFGI
jgi:two-component system, LytTR family, response regulator LytT